VRAAAAGARPLLRGAAARAGIITAAAIDDRVVADLFKAPCIFVVVCLLLAMSLPNGWHENWVGDLVFCSDVCC
jgi:hypothetical protein